MFWETFPSKKKDKILSPRLSPLSQLELRPGVFLLLNGIGKISIWYFMQLSAVSTPHKSDTFCYSKSTFSVLQSFEII